MEWLNVTMLFVCQKNLVVYSQLLRKQGAVVSMNAEYGYELINKRFFVRCAANFFMAPVLLLWSPEAARTEVKEG